jgi:hypothetical protein
MLHKLTIAILKFLIIKINYLEILINQRKVVHSCCNLFEWMSRKVKEQHLQSIISTVSQTFKSNLSCLEVTGFSILELPITSFANRVIIKILIKEAQIWQMGLIKVYTYK